mmetsp:Transcript_13464/g.28715  ORF Transcript_13464/g.28715 Transcript_13464/m.28715 type:complete len:342 (-) Transcript_13464:299-1324(-)
MSWLMRASGVREAGPSSPPPPVMCTWMSTKPGTTTHPVASTTMAATSSDTASSRAAASSSSSPTTCVPASRRCLTSTLSGRNTASAFFTSVIRNRFLLAPPPPCSGTGTGVLAMRRFLAFSCRARHERSSLATATKSPLAPRRKDTGKMPSLLLPGTKAHPELRSLFQKVCTVSRSLGRNFQQNMACSPACACWNMTAQCASLNCPRSTSASTARPFTETKSKPPGPRGLAPAMMLCAYRLAFFRNDVEASDRRQPMHALATITWSKLRAPPRMDPSQYCSVGESVMPSGALSGSAHSSRFTSPCGKSYMRSCSSSLKKTVPSPPAPWTGRTTTVRVLSSR